jgi:hypothetical protein
MEALVAFTVAFAYRGRRVPLAASLFVARNLVALLVASHDRASSRQAAIRPISSRTAGRQFEIFIAYALAEFLAVDRNA